MVDTLRSKHTEQCIVCCVSCRDSRYKRSKHVMLQWVYVETVDTLRSKHTEKCIVCCVPCRDSQYNRSKHVMLQWVYVDTVDTVVFAAFTQMHTDTQTWCTACMPLAPPREKALKPPVLWV